MENLNAKIAKFSEYSKYVAFTAVVVGIGFLIYGAYSYWDASQEISDLEADRERVENALQGAETITDPESIVFSDIERRERHDEMVDQQQLAQRFAGLGIVLIAVAWLVRNLVLSRYGKQKAHVIEPERDVL